MEINKYTDIMGVITGEDIPEGRMVALTSHTENYDFGSKVDLPGVRLPNSAVEALEAKYVITWPVSNANAEGPIRMFIPTPSFTWALRHGGWDQAANVPFSAVVHLTYPGHKDGVVIPSGFQALAFDRGVFTVPSGHFVYAAGLNTPGTWLEALNKADDTAAEAGKLSVTTTKTESVAVVERFDLEKYSLTFRTL
jgi:hypothetical protein